MAEARIELTDEWRLETWVIAPVSGRPIYGVTKLFRKRSRTYVRREEFNRFSPRTVLAHLSSFCSTAERLSKSGGTFDPLQKFREQMPI